MDADKIRQLYQDPSRGLDSITSFARRENIPYEDARSALKGDDVYTLNKYARYTYPRRKIVLSHIDEMWSMDLMDVQSTSRSNDGIRYLLIIVDGLSKYVWVVPLKTKEGAVVASAFQGVITSSGRSPRSLWIDEGTEFLNRHFKAVCEKYHISTYHTWTAYGSVFAERFIRTLRMRLAKLMDVRGSVRYIDVLDGIISLYNTTPHSLTKIAPANVAPADETRISSLMRQGAAPNTPPVFKVGQHVRMADERGMFSKEATTQRWSRQIFIVRRIIHSHPVVYELEDLSGTPVEGYLYEPELQAVDKPVKFAEEIVRTRTRQGVKEELVHRIGYPARMDFWRKVE